jgi:hypothetical protein
MTDAQEVFDVNMLHEHQQVILTTSVPELALQAGDVGLVVHRHRNREAFEVEFLTLDGETAVVTTLAANQVRAARMDEIPHARLRIAD